jgi:hypothetical protein
LELRVVTRDVVVVMKRAFLVADSSPLISDHRVNSSALRPTLSFIQLSKQHHSNMKSSLLLSLCTAAFVAGAAHPKDPQVVLQESQATFVEPDEYLIELSPGETRLVTEEGKWELRRVRIYKR